MITRILVAGILAGIIVFMWQAVAHMHLPLGDAGMKSLPNETATMAALKSTIDQPGFYFFPAPDRSPGLSNEQREQAMRKAMEKMRTGPAGILIVQPQGMDMLMTRQLAMQFVFDVVEMLLAAFVLSWAMATKGYVSRVLFIVVLGLFPTLVVELPLWNWYSFPVAYIAAQFVIHLVGFLGGGLVIAAVVRRPIHA